MLTFIKDARNHWTVVVNNKSYQFDPSHDKYDKLVECVKEDEAEIFVNLMEKGRVITSWSDGKFVVNEGVLTYDGESIHPVLANRVLEMIEQEFDYLPMLNFIEKLYKNVSMRSVVELYNFLEHKFLPITSDGCFIAYKGVSRYSGSGSKDRLNRSLIEGDFVDKYTNKSYRNNIGDINTMTRRNVNDDANIGCAEGLHVGSLEYARDYACGGPVVLCKVDPSNVVSVPHDCNCQKVRVSEYEVVGVYENQVFDRAVESQYDAEDSYYEDEDEDDLEDPYAGDGW